MSNIGKLLDEDEPNSPKDIAGFPVTSVGKMEKYVNILIYGEPGVGKGHPHGTLILTPTGWRPIEDFTVGDTVIASDGKPCMVTGVHHRGTLPVNRVTLNDGSSVLVDDEHLWRTRNKNDQNRGNPWRVVDTTELASKVKQGWRIPIVEPVQMVRRETALDPYVMGVLLGDGSFRGNSVRLSTDEHTRYFVERRMPVGVRLTEGYDAYIVTDRGQPNPVLDEIKAQGLHGLGSQEKFVPNDYLYGAVDQRLALLRGLMDTDGELSNNTARFTSTSAHLADAVEFLVQSLGGVTRRTYKATPKYKYKGETKIGKPTHIVNVNMSLSPFESRTDYVGPTKYLPNRVIKSIEPEGSAEVICLSVDSSDSTYVTENCIVTHNTVLAGSASDVKFMAPVLLLDIEGGTMSLSDTYPNVDVIRITHWMDLQKIYNKLFQGDHNYKTIILDSLTEAQKLSMNDIMRKAVKEDPDLDPDVPTMRAWGKNIEQMRKFTRALRDLPVNVIFTALVDSDKDNRGKTVSRPSFQGKLKGEVPGFMDIVAFYYVRQVGDNLKRLLLTQQTDTTIAKDRSNKLPKLMEDPTMGTIYQEILGTKEKN